MEAAIRPATRDDLPGIVAIYNEAVQDTTGTYDAEPHTLEQRTAWFEHYEAKEYPILVEDMVRGWGSLSPFVERPLSQLHSGEKDGTVPGNKARSLQVALVGWLKDTGSSYAAAVAQRRMNTTHINQVPVLATPVAAAARTIRASRSLLTTSISVAEPIASRSADSSTVCNRAAALAWVRTDW